jgi:putative two-component system hydrogenase maturation factor HypX/HoxX
MDEAQAIGLIDDIVLRDDLCDSPFRQFRDQVTRTAEALSSSPLYGTWLRQKQTTRERDERVRPLEDYRRRELEEMQKNFWGADHSYHLARAAFVRKQPRLRLHQAA